MDIRAAMLKLIAEERNDLERMKDYLGLPPEVDPNVDAEETGELGHEYSGHSTLGDVGGHAGSVGNIEDLRMPTPGYPLGDVSPVQNAWDQIIAGYKDKGFKYYKLSNGWDEYAPRVEQYYLWVSKDKATWYSAFYFVFYSPDESEYTNAAGFDFSGGEGNKVFEIDFADVDLTGHEPY